MVADMHLNQLVQITVTRIVDLQNAANCVLVLFIQLKHINVLVEQICTFQVMAIWSRPRDEGRGSPRRRGWVPQGIPRPGES